MNKSLYLRIFVQKSLIMKKTVLKLFLVFGCFSFIINSTNAQFNDCIFNTSDGKWYSGTGGPCVNTIITAVPFLRIIPDARAGAMGDAGIATSADPNAMHFNASKLAFAEKDMGISVTYTPWLRALGLNDVYLAYLSGYKQIDKLQSVGVGLRYFSLGSISFTDDNGGSLGTGRPNEFELKLSYARQLAKNFSVAVGGKFIYSNLAAGQSVDNIDIKAGTAGAADFSFTYRKPLKISDKASLLTIGLALSNLGTKISYTNSVNKDFIPANFGLGAALDYNFDEYNTITFTMDVNKLMVPTPIDPSDPLYDEDGDDIADYRQQSMFAGMLSSFGDAPNGISEEVRELMYSVGAEYWYDKQFAVRAGYYSEHSTKGNRKFFTVGLGLKYNIFGLNFSYLVPTTNQRNPLDNTLRFSLLFDFAAFESDEE